MKKLYIWKSNGASERGTAPFTWLQVAADSGIKYAEVGNPVRMRIHISESETHEGFGTALLACILPNDRYIIGGLLPTGVSNTGFYASPYIPSRLPIIIASK